LWGGWGGWGGVGVGLGAALRPPLALTVSPPWAWQGASHMLERAIWEGGLVCARHAVMSREAVPATLRDVVEYSTEALPDGALK
jgi:hypothetical protein